ESVLERPQMARDARFADNNARVANRDALDAAIASALAAMDAPEFRSRLLEHRIAFGAVNGVPEVSAHAALRRRAAVNVLGAEVPIPDHPVKWRGESWRDNLGAPPLGRDSERIRREFDPGESS